MADDISHRSEVEWRDVVRFLVSYTLIWVVDTIYIAVSERDSLGPDHALVLAAMFTIIKAIREPKTREAPNV